MVLFPKNWPYYVLVSLKDHLFWNTSYFQKFQNVEQLCILDFMKYSKNISAVNLYHLDIGLPPAYAA